MAKIYKPLTTQERAVVMTIRDDLRSIRSIAIRNSRLYKVCGATLASLLEIKSEAQESAIANNLIWF